MKYGMPTLAKYNSILENVDFAIKNHLDFVELNMDLPYCFEMHDLKKYDIEFTMHISEEVNVADLNPFLKKDYLDEAIREIMLGIENGIKKYNLHLDTGVYFTMPSGKYYLNDKYIDIYLKHLQDSCLILNDLAKDKNIEINFENTKINDFIKEAVKVIEEYPYLGFTLDIGHNEKDGNKAYPIFKETNCIRHIHMHDYDGKSDHLALLSGKIDFHKYQDVLKDKYIVIEVKEEQELIDSIKNVKEIK